MDRRNFLKVAAAGSAALLTGPGRAQASEEKTGDDSSMGVLVDTVACVGCRKCEWACNDANALPTQELKAFEDKSVFARQRRPDSRAYTVVNQFSDPARPEKPCTVKVQCMHCNKPACASACIVGALRKEPTGAVSYDADKCIGCRYCMVACPFQVPAYEYDNVLTPQVRKCTFCSARLAEGKRPACVSICPEEALTFGKRSELLDVARTRILAKPDKYVNHIYGEHEAGGTAWLYLAGTDLVNAGLPALPGTAFPERVESIQHAIFKSFVPPLALYGLLGLAMNAFKPTEDNQDSNHGKHEHESR